MGSLSFKILAIISKSHFISYPSRVTATPATLPQLKQIKKIAARKNPKLNPENRMTIYVGPLSLHVRRYKRLALLFCTCGFLLVPSIYFYGKAPIVGATGVGLSSLVPLFFINYLSATYVSRIYIYLPPQRRYEPSLRKSFNPYALHSSGDPYLTIETFDWLGRIEETTLKLSELKEFKNKNKFQWITWVKQENDNRIGKRFYVEKRVLKQDVFSKGLVEWIEKQNGLSQVQKTNDLK
ncbi:4-coumarate-CoA ligase 2 [Rhizophagus clarus]|uniref:4-coumarate-CoA ligase 2 n=1 Tax=Rhizophagus clarus TaxID=94130 RepID=A0A8H3KZV6_9GLOM|nr:4-coumarate-CoA ligase 2 [Rhizophagus clarus]